MPNLVRRSPAGFSQKIGRASRSRAAYPVSGIAIMQRLRPAWVAEVQRQGGHSAGIVIPSCRIFRHSVVLWMPSSLAAAPRFQACRRRVS